MGVGALICRYWPFYRDQTGPSGDHKLETLDGLRAYLALGVFFHHGVITYFWMVTGKWNYPPSTFYTLIGPSSVGVFFMITGFLFWTKAIRGSARMPAKKLWIGRVLRVGPMYLVVSFVVFFTIFAESRFRLWGTPRELAIGLLSPLTLGLVKWQSINGINPGLLNAEVNWTLQYEWLFYLALPVLAILAKPSRFPLLVVAAIAVFPMANEMRAYWCGLYFLFGMAAAHSLQSFGKIPNLSSRLASLASLGLLALIPIASAYGTLTEKAVILISLFFLFVCLVHGNTLFGIMTTRGAKLLGLISYSIYLIHGFVLYLGRYPFARWLDHEPPSPTTFWIFLAFCGLASILLSAITYRLVEHPFIGLSHRLGRRLPEVKPTVEG